MVISKRTEVSEVYVEDGFRRKALTDKYSRIISQQGKVNQVMRKDFRKAKDTDKYTQYRIIS